MPIKISFVDLFQDAPYLFKESNLWMFILTFLNYGFIHIILADHFIDRTLIVSKENIITLVFIILHIFLHLYTIHDFWRQLYSG